MKPTLVTTSWDDGHVQDMKLGALLNRYGLAGTFYIAPEDREFTPDQRLTNAQIKQLARDFEIGAHTVTHPRLTTVDDTTAEREIRDSKSRLQSIIGRTVTSFCYPGGAYNHKHAAMAKRAGFTYARTVDRFQLGRAQDAFTAGTTVHAYRHWSDVVRIARFARFNPVKTTRYLLNWDQLAMALFDRTQQIGGVFHLWGHSWEIDRNQDWGKLERVFQHISGRSDVAYVPNQELAQPATPTLLLVTPYFHPRTGGLEIYAINLARQLTEKFGWRVVVVTSTQPGQAEGVYDVQGLKVHRLRARFKLANTGWSPSWTKKLRQIVAIEQPTVINAHAPVPGLVEPAARAAGHRPFVLTWHAGSMKKGQFVSDLLTGTYEAVVLPWLARRSSTIICSSDFVKSGIMGGRSQTVTIPPGVDTSRFTPARRLASDTVVFIAGGLNHTDQYKGLGKLLEAMREVQAAIPAAKLVVVGDGNHRSEYEQIARKYRVNADFTGVLHGDDLVRTLRSGTVFVLPTSNDSYPTVILEAMACGLPVVSTRIGSIPQIINDGVTGQLIEPTTAEIADSLKRYLSDPKLAAEQGAAGRAQVVTHNDWRIRAGETAAALQSATQPKIVQVVPYYPPHVGGMENVARELSGALARQGHRVEVQTSNIGLPKTAPSDQLAPAGPTVRRLWTFELLQTPIMPGLFWQVLRQPRGTIVHLHVAQALVPEITLLAAKLRGLPLIAHVHLDVEPSSRIGEIIFRPYKRIFLSRVLRAANHVIVLSPDQRDRMISLYNLDPNRVSVMSNGVGEQYFMPQRRRAHQPFRLLYVGRLAVQKRPERLIATAAQLGPAVHLDIVGDGADRAGLEAQAQAARLGNVTFHGFKRGAELLEYYRQADAFILTSDREGSPLVMLEAMAAALPVVGSDVLGIREHLAGVGILVEPSAAKFAAAVDAFRSNPADYTEYSRLSRAAAATQTWDVLAGRLAQLYREISA